MFVCGPSRTLTNLVLYSLAQATNPDFRWLDIAIRGARRPAADPVALGWIPEDRLWSVDRLESLMPDDRNANLATFAVVRSDEPARSLTRLVEFVRLPVVAQEILSYRPPQHHPGLLAAANCHRLLSAYSANAVPPILDVLTSSGYSLFVGFADSAPPACEAFDVILRLDEECPARWRTASIVCEKGIDSGPLEVGRPCLLGDLGFLADALTRAIPST